MTQSGGVHLWFRQPDDGGEPIRNRGNLPRHVDVRGQGGYVVAPPSVTFDDEGIRSAASGRRNAQLNESAFKVATLAAAGAVDAAFARACVEAAARDNPGQDDDRQLAATIDSGWTAGIEHAARSNAGC